MTISSLDAARKICELGNWQITNLKLQKMLYLAHLVYLGRTRYPLIREHFEAWDFGPVEPQLYHTVKFFGSDPIKLIPSSIVMEKSNFSTTIEEVFQSLRNKTPGQLVQLTHRRNGAWHRTYSPARKGLRINDEYILAEYDAFSKN